RFQPHRFDEFAWLLLIIAVRVGQSTRDGLAALFGLIVAICGVCNLRESAGCKQQKCYNLLHNGSSMGMANGASSRKSCAAISATASRTDCSEVGSTVITNGRSRQFSAG